MKNSFLVLVLLIVLVLSPFAQAAQGIKDLTLAGTSSVQSGATLGVAGTLNGAGTFNFSLGTLTLADGQIGWAKVSKTGSSLADLATRSAADLTGLGTGVGTALATPSSANIASAVTDETGSGSLVFGTSPTLTTPNIGAATGTSVNLTSGGTFGGNISLTGTLPFVSFGGSTPGGASDRWIGWENGGGVVVNGGGTSFAATINGSDMYRVSVASGHQFYTTRARWIPSTFSLSSWTTAGALSDWGPTTVTNSTTAVGGTAASATFYAFGQPTLAATNANVTTTDAATVYIAGAPVAGTNQTITTPHALLVGSGDVAVKAGGAVYTYVSNNTSYGRFRHNGTATLLENNAGDIRLMPTTGGVRINGANETAAAALDVFGAVGGVGLNVRAGATTLAYNASAVNLAITNTANLALMSLNGNGSTATGFFSNVSNGNDWSINRNPITGTFTDTGLTHAKISVNSGVNDSSIVFYTSPTNNTTAVEAGRFTKNGTLTVSGSDGIGSTFNIGNNRTALTVTGSSASDTIFTLKNTSTSGKEYQFRAMGNASGNITAGSLLIFCEGALTEWAYTSGALIHYNGGVYSLVNNSTGSNDAFVAGMRKDTYATSGATSKTSPRVRWESSAWNSSSAAEERLNFIAENVGTTAAGTTSAVLNFKYANSAVSSGAYSTLLSLSSAGLAIAGTSAVKGIRTATATLDFGSIDGAAQADLTITVTGAATNDDVQLGLPAAPTAGIVFNAFVSATNTVTVRATNITGSPVDPASATYRATVKSF